MIPAQRDARAARACGGRSGRVRVRVAPVHGGASGAPNQVTAWAVAAGTGDATAQAAFVRATHAEVWRFTATLVDRSAADDLTQETYLRVLRVLPGFTGDADARTWLLAIARRVCADYARTLVRRRLLDQRLVAGGFQDMTEPDASGEFGAADLLRRLPEHRRTAFALTQVLGLSYAEAALVERVPVGTIRSRIARARADLVEALGEALAS